MDSYIDIEIKPDAEMQESVLLGIVYTKLHKVLVKLKTDCVGVSFPRYRLKLGNLVRVHANRAVLVDLMGTDWLGGLSGYCQVSNILAVPEITKHIVISRKQCNMTQAKLKRLIKRESISTDDVKKYRAKMFSQGLDNPYIELQSSSTGHRHRRYIEFGKLLDSPLSGEFDFFGLSKKATVPWF